MDADRDNDPPAFNATRTSDDMANDTISDSASESSWTDSDLSYFPLKEIEEDLFTNMAWLKAPLKPVKKGVPTYTLYCKKEYPQIQYSRPVVSQRASIVDEDEFEKAEHLVENGESQYSTVEQMISHPVIRTLADENVVQTYLQIQNSSPAMSMRASVTYEEENKELEEPLVEVPRSQSSRAFEKTAIHTDNDGVLRARQIIKSVGEQKTMRMQNSPRLMSMRASLVDIEELEEPQLEAPRIQSSKATLHTDNVETPTSSNGRQIINSIAEQKTVRVQNTRMRASLINEEEMEELQRQILRSRSSKATLHINNDDMPTSSSGRQIIKPVAEQKAVQVQNSRHIMSIRASLTDEGQMEELQLEIPRSHPQSSTTIEDKTPCTFSDDMPTSSSGRQIIDSVAKQKTVGMQNSRHMIMSMRASLINEKQMGILERVASFGSNDNMPTSISQGGGQVVEPVVEQKVPDIKKSRHMMTMAPLDQKKIALAEKPLPAIPRFEKPLPELPRSHSSTIEKTISLAVNEAMPGSQSGNIIKPLAQKKAVKTYPQIQNSNRVMNMRGPLVQEETGELEAELPVEIPRSQPSILGTAKTPTTTNDIPKSQTRRVILGDIPEEKMADKLEGRLQKARKREGEKAHNKHFPSSRSW